jgi:N4-gp56 family major capsid protein
VASTTTTLNDLIHTNQVEARVLDYARALAFMPSLVSNYTVDYSTTLTIPKWGSISAAALTEGTSITPTNHSTDGVSVTVGEVGGGSDVTDLANETALIDAVNGIGMQWGKAIAEKIDTDLMALFSGFSQSVGTTATDLTLDVLMTAIQELEEANAPGQPVMVLHPRQLRKFRQLVGGTSGSTATFFGNPGAIDINLRGLRGFAGEWMGVAIYRSTLVPTVNAAVDYCGALFVPEALALVTQKPIHMEATRDAYLRGWNVATTACYGVAEINDTYGCRIISVVA